jgi:hypothetical protein
MWHMAGGRALISKDAFGRPTLCGFRKGWGFSLVPFLISNLYFLISFSASVAAVSGGGWTSWQAGSDRHIGAIDGFTSGLPVNRDLNPN